MDIGGFQSLLWVLSFPFAFFGGWMLCGGNKLAAVLGLIFSVILLLLSLPASQGFLL